MAAAGKPAATWSEWVTTTVREHQLRSVGACVCTAARLLNVAAADQRFFPMMRARARLLLPGTLWAAGVTGSLLYNWTRPIPTSLKLIHSCAHTVALGHRRRRPWLDARCVGASFAGASTRRRSPSAR
jgi:hypothetical protein